MLFSDPPGADAKKSVAMYSVDGADVQTYSRPKGKIVAKNDHIGLCRRFQMLDDNHLVAGYSPQYIGQEDLTVIYELPGFDEVDKIVGLGNKIDIHHTRRLLLGNAEDEANLAKFGKGIASIDPLQLKKVAALRGPSVWIQDDGQGSPEFLCCVTNWTQIEKVNAANEYLLPVFRPLRETTSPLLRINHDEQTATLVYEFETGIKDGIGDLILNRSGDTLYYATHRKLGAFDLASASVKWERELAREPVEVYDVFHFYGFALSHDEKLLAAGGIAAEEFSEHEFVILDTATGETVLNTALCPRLTTTPVIRQKTSTHSICWHPAGWCAVGTAAGIVVHIAPDGRFRTYKGAPKGIEALQFINDHQTLLVGSGEKQYRAWSLLEDELG